MLYHYVGVSEEEAFLRRRRQSKNSSKFERQEANSEQVHIAVGRENPRSAISRFYLGGVDLRFRNAFNGE